MQHITVEVDVLLCPAPEERPRIGRDWEWLSAAGQKQEGERKVASLRSVHKYLRKIPFAHCWQPLIVMYH